MKRWYCPLLALALLVGSARAQLPVTAAPVPAPSAMTAPPPAPASTNPSIAAAPAPAPPPAPKTLEQRVEELEKQMAQVIQSLQAIAQNATSVDFARGLARDIVALNDEIIAMKRTAIPAPKTAPKTAVPAKR